MIESAILNELNKTLSSNFIDYKGMYFFGSRLLGNNRLDSDYDVVFIFDRLDYEKELRIAGIISEFEYQHNVFVDCKLLTSSGTKSVEYIRLNVNPVFIQKAVDEGKFFERV